MGQINSMVNSWECQHDKLTSLSSGYVASDDVVMDMTRARGIGEEKLQGYIKNRED